MAQPTANVAQGEQKDIWEDIEVLWFLQTHQYGNGLSAFNKDRVSRRAKSYRSIRDNLFRLQSRAAMVVVPTPKERIQLALDAHEAVGTLELCVGLDATQLLVAGHGRHSCDYSQILHVLCTGEC